jgi:polyphosphate kinase 2 (PPK2 family)
MKIEVNGKKIKITDNDKDEKKTLVKHKGKKFTDLVQAEKDELILALLQRSGMAGKNGKIKQGVA